MTANTQLLLVVLVAGLLLVGWPLLKWLAGGWVKARLGLETHRQAFRKKSVVELLTLRDNLEKQGNKQASATCKSLIVAMVNEDEGK